MSAPAWIWALAVAIALGISVELYRRRARVRRLRIREALHELRRPLQAVILAGEAGPKEDPLLTQLRTALSDLEDAIAGRDPGSRRDPVRLDDLFADASRRWRRQPDTVRFQRPTDPVLIEADRVRLGMALDNLIANGLEHGSGPVEVATSLGERRLRLEVSNRRRRGSLPPDGSIVAPKGIADPRRGHGLRIAGRHAAAAEGALLPPQTDGDDRVVAAVELPCRDQSVPS